MGDMVFPYKKILVPYDGSKQSENALQQAIQLADFSFSSGTTTESIQIILLHIVEEIHIRIPNLYFGLRILAGKSMKKFFEEVYEDILRLSKGLCSFNRTSID